MMRYNISIFMVLAAHVVVALPITNAIDVARVRMRDLQLALPQGFPDVHDLRNEWAELGVRETPQFGSVRQIVTSEWVQVVSRLSDISTNENERLVALAAGYSQTEDEYLQRIGVLADAVSSNQISQAEMRFYRITCVAENCHATSVLIRSYDVPAVSNLILKLSGIGYFPEGTAYIFNGEAKALDESWEEETRAVNE